MLIANQIPEVTPPRDSSVQKHALDREVARFAGITRRLGFRLSSYLNKTKESGVLPDEGFVENYRLYSWSLLGLLREQRERAKLAKLTGLNELTDAEHTEALEAFKRETLLAMSDEELERLKAERKAGKP